MQAGPGRPKGSENKATKELKEFWGKWFKSKEYQVNAQQRILDGKAPHLEGYLMSKIHGKPTEHIEVTGKDGGPIVVHDHFYGTTPPVPST